MTRSGVMLVLHPTLFVSRVIALKLGFRSLSPSSQSFSQPFIFISPHNSWRFISPRQVRRSSLSHSLSLCSFSCGAVDLLPTIPTCRSLMFSLHLYPVWSNQYSSANRGDRLAIPHKERFFFPSDRLLEVRWRSAERFNGHLIKNSVRLPKRCVPLVKE